MPTINSIGPDGVEREIEVPADVYERVTGIPGRTPLDEFGKLLFRGLKSAFNLLRAPQLADVKAGRATFEEFVLGLIPEAGGLMVGRKALGARIGKITDVASLSAKYPAIPDGILKRIRSVKISDRVGEMSLDARGANLSASTERSLLHEVGHLAEFELNAKQHKVWAEIVRKEMPKGVHGLGRIKEATDPYYIIENLANSFREYHLGSGKLDKFPRAKAFVGQHLAGGF